MKSSLPPAAAQQTEEIHTELLSSTSPQQLGENDEEVDIEKLFESYEKIYMNDKELSQPLDDEIEANDIVSSVKEIVANASNDSARFLSNDSSAKEKTVVVVVNTNTVVNSDDKVINQQHEELSFGHPLLVAHKEPVETVNLTKATTINVDNSSHAIFFENNKKEFAENESTPIKDIVFESKTAATENIQESPVPTNAPEEAHVFTPSTQYQNELTTPSPHDPIEGSYSKLKEYLSK